MKKRKDECLLCKSRACYMRIVRKEEPCYDEIACSKHILDLEKHSDETLGKGNGVMRNHIWGSERQKRGCDMNA